MPTPASSIRNGSFFENFNPHQFTLIAWNVGTLIQQAQPLGFAPNTLHHTAVEQFKSRYMERFSEILKWVEDGNSLLLFPTLFPVFRYPDGTPSGSQIDINQLPPFNHVELAASKGDLIHAAPAFLQQFADFADLFRYEYVLQGEGLLPLYETSSVRRQRSQIAGGVVRVGNGVIVFSPIPRDWAFPQINNYFGVVGLLPQLLRPAVDAVPDWTRRFQSNLEHEATKRAILLETQIEDLRQQAEAQKRIVCAENELKLLYVGTGDSLVDTTIAVLREFDLKVVKGPHPRADLLIYDGQRLAAGEVKGLDGPVRENNHRQAMRWAADVDAALTSDEEDRKRDPDILRYVEKLKLLGLDLKEPLTNMECRALMIIGTHRNTPLDQRAQDDFPDAVRRSINRSKKVCALTGLTLYCLLQEIRADPARKSALADELFADGILSTADWQKAIVQSPSDHAPTAC
jgi:hypothetical protein